MTSRCRALNKHIKQLDYRLYAVDCEIANGETVAIYRKGEYSTSAPLFIIALTDNWYLNGSPRNWGVDPVIRRLCEMDQWSKANSIYDDLKKERERKEELKQREWKNNVKALAYDFRKEFAKATNDVNTSSLEKIDNRRKKDGYC